MFSFLNRLSNYLLLSFEHMSSTDLQQHGLKTKLTMNMIKGFLNLWPSLSKKKWCYLSIDLVNVCVLFNLTQLLLISVNKQRNTNNLWVIFRNIQWKEIVADMMIILCLHGGLHNISLCLYHKPVLQFVLPCLSSLHI